MSCIVFFLEKQFLPMHLGADDITDKSAKLRTQHNVVLLCACCIKISTNFEALYCLGLMDKLSLLLLYYTLT